MDKKKTAKTHTLTATEQDTGNRIDVFVANSFPDHSRSFFKKCFSGGLVILNGAIITRPSISVKENDVIVVTFPSKPEGIRDVPPEIQVPIIHKDPNFFITCKPAGLTTHSSTTDPKAVTLVDWLLKNFPELADVGEPDRPGIVHRLDKNTSGVMIIARTKLAHMIFTDLFKQRKIQKTYLAIVKGHPDKQGVMSQWIDRHPILKHKMKAFTPENAGSNARQAETHYKVIKYFEDSTLLECKPTTGRTHQIRVHCAAMKHSIIGDTTYGQKSKIIKRHALHALSIEFTFEGKLHSFTCKPPEDFQKLMDQPTVPAVL